MGDRGAIFLSKILPRSKSLHTLKLNYCEIGCEAMRTLLLSLFNSTRDKCGVQALFIEYNKLDESIMPTIGMILSREECPTKLIHFGGYFNYAQVVNNLEPGLFQSKSVGFGTLKLVNYGSREVIRKVFPKIRVFIETASSSFDAEYFICELCTILSLPSMHFEKLSMEKHGDDLVVLHLHIQDMPDIVGNEKGKLPRNYELKAKLLHLYGNPYAPEPGQLYKEDLNFLETIHPKLNELGIVNIDSLSTTDAEDIAQIRKDDAENDDFSSPLGDALYSPSRKSLNKQITMQEKIDMLDKIFDYAIERDSDDDSAIDWDEFDFNGSDFECGIDIFLLESFSGSMVTR